MFGYCYDSGQITRVFRKKLIWEGKLRGENCREFRRINLGRKEREEDILQNITRINHSLSCLTDYDYPI